MHQIQIPIGTLPIALTLISDGSVAFSRTANFKTICADDAIFDNEGFQLGNTANLCYNVKYNYKEIPNMLKWLQAQNLKEPENIFFGG